ncbi:MAG: hypothetical protein QX189_13390 [Methylococcales bacterium]
MGNTLWVYNPQQLAELKEWIQADLREREKDSTWGWSNQSYFSRLPRWLKLAKNRTVVLSAIAKLEALLT